MHMQTDPHALYFPTRSKGQALGASGSPVQTAPSRILSPSSTHIKCSTRDVSRETRAAPLLPALTFISPHLTAANNPHNGRLPPPLRCHP